MKKKLFLIFVFVSSLIAIEKPNITYLKTHKDDIVGEYKDIGNNTIRWTFKANKNNLMRLLSHIKYMKNKIDSGHSPRKMDLLFNIENIMGKYVHYQINFENGNLIIDKSADNDCAFEIVKTHAKIVKEDFMTLGDLTKNYSDKAKEIINSPACKEFKDILK
jgi:hypothetical protein